LSNIGMALAEINCRTLIIDADLRCPRMHKVYDRPNENGLSSLLNTDFREQDLRNLIQPTSVSGLDVLTAGESSSTNSYLFHSPTLPKLLEMVKRDYRIVLIDTPPLLYTSDARVIARLADATILIARAGKTSRDALLTARQRLEDDGIRILGSVLNDWDPKSSDPDYYKGYRSYLRAKSVAANAS